MLRPAYPARGQTGAHTSSPLPESSQPAFVSFILLVASTYNNRGFVLRPSLVSRRRYREECVPQVMSQALIRVRETLRASVEVCASEYLRQHSVLDVPIQPHRACNLKCDAPGQSKHLCRTPTSGFWPHRSHEMLRCAGPFGEAFCSRSCARTRSYPDLSKGDTRGKNGCEGLCASRCFGSATHCSQKSKSIKVENPIAKAVGE